MARVQAVQEGAFNLPEDALCFGPDGWQPVPFRILIQLEGMTLPQVVEQLWRDSQTLLGAGELVFFHEATENQKPKGYIVFLPENEPCGNS